MARHGTTKVQQELALTSELLHSGPGGKENKMTLTYANGNTTEAILLARMENKLRAAIPGGDEPLELTNVHGIWVSEECEPVRVEFAWERKTREEVLTEAECVCSHDLAARLIHLLWTDSDHDEVTPDPALSAMGLPSVWAISQAN
jgi:hypothetical protein